MKPAFILLLFSLFLVSTADAQKDAGMQFHHISLEQGLSDARISAITQDKYGFLWIGTAAGLNRYDGYNFRVFTEAESGLHNNSIVTLYASKAGNLYVSDGDGLLEYNFATDHFERPAGTDSSDLNRKHFTVTLMKEDAFGRLYIGCAEGLFRFSPKKHLLEDMNLHNPLNWRIKNVSGLTFGSDGRLWITTQKQGFFAIDPDKNTFLLVPHDKEYGHDTGYYAIHRTVFLNDSLLLVGQHSYGLTILNTLKLTFTPQKGSLGKNDSIRFNAVYRLIKDYKGRIWGGTAYHGLIQYHPESKAVTVFRNDPFNPYSYGGYRVFALFEDREHNIWVGTGGHGVYWFNPDKTGVRYFPWNPISPRSPPGPEVLSTAVRDSVSMWIGTDKGPAAFYFKKDSFVAYKYENSYNSSLPGSNINYIYKADDGATWFAMRSLGVSRFDENRYHYDRFLKADASLKSNIGKPDKSPIPANVINKIEQDLQGRILLLIKGSITRLDFVLQASSFRSPERSDTLLRLDNIYDILRAGNRLWLGISANKQTQVVRYDFRTKMLTHVATLDSIGKMRINNMQLLPDSSIAIASSEGIFILSASGSSLRHYSYRQDNKHQNIIGLVAEGNKTLWMCTDRNIGRLDLQTENWLWLGNGDGIKPTRFFGDAFRMMPDQRIVAGSGDGLFIIDPAGIKSETVQPPLLVDFKVYGKPFSLPSALQEINTITLRHDENFFSFSMSSMQYGGSGSIEYSYRLRGYDKEWQAAGAERNGQYTGVPGGSYELQLRARTENSEWIVSPQKIEIEVGKPWWETWIFRFIALILLLGMVALLFLYRVGSIRKSAKLRTDYEIRLNELEMSALRTQMNPHFIFNCLNTINSYINSNQRTQANLYITRFARLIRLILENSRQRRVSLNKELEALRLYLDLEALRFEERFTYQIQIDPSLDPENIELPPLLLQPFAENAILHGILPQKEKGLIKINIEQQNNLVFYTIEDNGIGRAAAAEKSANSALKKESHGMAITEKRIELFNRENGAENAGVLVEDLMRDGTPSGTKVTIPLALVEAF